MPLSPLGERVACDGVFISRSGPGEGVPAGPLIVNNSLRIAVASTGMVAYSIYKAAELAGKAFLAQGREGGCA
jgi:hypothetical protein